jgi:hypothetical protein
MKAELKRNGHLHLIVESEIEYYALQRWRENQYIIIEEVKPQEHPEHFIHDDHYRTS